MKQNNQHFLISLINRIPKSEAQLQSKCAELLYYFYRNDYKRLVCVHNNSFRANTQGFGIVKGASDTYWMGENRTVIFIEFKFGPHANQSKEQIEFEELCKRLGHTYYLCDTEHDFWRIIELKRPEVVDVDNLE